MNPQTGKPPATLIWWIIWAAITFGLTVIYFTMQKEMPLPTANSARYLPLIPLFGAVLLRWFVLPRFTERMRAFPIFIVGLALAEGSGILGIFLVPDLAPTYFLLALFGLLQFAPFFAARYSA
jgi:hypothetical protein